MFWKKCLIENHIFLALTKKSTKRSQYKPSIDEDFFNIV